MADKDPIHVPLMREGTFAVVGNGHAVSLMTFLLGRMINSFGQTKDINEVVQGIAAETTSGEVIGRMARETILIQDAMGEVRKCKVTSKNSGIAGFSILQMPTILTIGKRHLVTSSLHLVTQWSGRSGFPSKVNYVLSITWIKGGCCSKSRREVFGYTTTSYFRKKHNGLIRNSLLVEEGHNKRPQRKTLHTFCRNVVSGMLLDELDDSKETREEFAMNYTLNAFNSPQHALKGGTYMAGLG
ncbi:hypothetical protein H6P81_015905 [Aristolochia fimbriata]|uniref:Uncharacterized protein n=1 Tax=Aristolochia fimbriata TaxID=158543 RepID=A0AAV7E8Y2_ARIFI|nr:hypothetical protein H6P81_015905 [Aristolochia fimbriata]